MTEKPFKVFIAGLGQIGGSIGLDLVRHRYVDEIIGYDINRSAANYARKIGAVNRTVLSISKGIKMADFIILAVPIRQIIKLIRKYGPTINSKKTVFDVAGTKSDIVNAVKAIGKPLNYISGHPITGTEKKGIKSASLGMFKNTAFIYSPMPDITTEHQNRAVSIIKMLGANPINMAPELHDKLIAITSNLPYVISLALINLYRQTDQHYPEIINMIGGSFRSGTRVASSSPELILDMFLTNHSEIQNAIDNLILELNRLKEIIADGQESKLKKIIKTIGDENTKIHQ